MTLPMLVLLLVAGSLVGPSRAIAVAGDSSMATGCAFAHRQRVRLRGIADYRNPFLWVTGPDRLPGDKALHEFQNGQGNDDFIYFHTRILDRDTAGIVTSACPHGSTRMLGVLITSGPHKGAYGFVDSRDAAYPPR